MRRGKKYRPEEHSSRRKAREACPSYLYIYKYIYLCIRAETAVLLNKAEGRNTLLQSSKERGGKQPNCRRCLVLSGAG